MDTPDAYSVLKSPPYPGPPCCHKASLIVRGTGIDSSNFRILHPLTFLVVCHHNFAAVAPKESTTPILSRSCGVTSMYRHIYVCICILAQVHGDRSPPCHVGILLNENLSTIARANEDQSQRQMPAEYRMCGDEANMNIGR